MANKQPTATAVDHVRAIARFRPIAGDHEVAAQWVLDKAAGTVSNGDARKPFKYTAVFGADDDNKAVFERSVSPLVDECVAGKNACVLLYGQSGSGKTHTVFGYSERDPGIVTLAVQHMFSRLETAKRSVRFRVAASFYEVYNETVNDLLNPGPSGANLQVREVNGVAYVEGLNIRMCHDAESVMRQVIDYGSANKTVGNSYIHDKSSRAHTVFMMQIATERRVRDVITTQISRFTFVDLAGSEVLSYEFGDQQQRETKAINLSLFALRGVISALANKEKFVPYRESVLTRLLAPCLSINSITAVICTISPSAAHVALSSSSLKFGEVSAMIEQRAALNEVLREGARKLRIKDTAVEESVALGERVKGAKDGGDDALIGAEAAAAIMEPIVIDTRQGPVQGYRMVGGGGSPIALTPQDRLVALCLHAYGNGCSGKDWDFVMRALCTRGYSCYSIDFPGFGATKGPRQASRTDRMDDAGGAMEVVYDALDAVTQRDRRIKVLVVGWDFGGNAALILAQGPWRARLSGLVLYHPSYTNKLEELATIAVPVLLCWIPSDQLHLIATGRRMARIIRRSKLVTMVLKPGRDKDYDDVWRALAEKMVEWLAQVPGLLPSPSPAAAAAVAKAISKRGGDAVALSSSSSEADDEIEADQDVDGDDDLLSTESSFLACLLCDPAAAAAVIEGTATKRKAAKTIITSEKASATGIFALATTQPTSATERLAWSIANLRDILCCDEKRMWEVRDALLQRNGMGGMRSAALGLVGGLPIIPPHCPAESFHALGLWPVLPRGSAFSPRLARYAVGRQVFIPALVRTDMRDAATFGCYEPSARRPFLTYRAVVTASSTAAECVCAVPIAAAGSDAGGSAPAVNVTVPWNAVLAWNQPTKFPTGPQSGVTLVFEDAIACRYHDVVTRLKMNEIALALAPLVAQMDFEAAVAERLNASASDLAAFPANERLLRLQVAAVKTIRGCMNMIHHVQMGKDPSRLCVPDCGRLSTVGQWHCHGMASVFASLLLPFATAIGVEVRYRDGFCGGGDDGGGREASTGWDGTPRSIADHTWLEVTFFPSQIPFVADPSFDHREGVLVPYEKAYSIHGGRFPMRNLTSGGIEDCRNPLGADSGAQQVSHLLRAADFV